MIINCHHPKQVSLVFFTASEVDFHFGASMLCLRLMLLHLFVSVSIN